MSDFIDTGDRVVIVSDGNPNGFGGQRLTEHKGQHGLVLSNDGFGRCRVLLDSGKTVDAWNAADLERENDPIREQAEGLARAMFDPAIDWLAAKDAMVLATIGEPDDHRGEA